MEGWRRATIVGRHDWAEGLSTFRFDVTLDEFQPGQFVNLALDEAKPDDKRSYSVASALGAPLELYITRVPGGALSTGLFEKAVGDVVLLNPKAQGFFTLDWVPVASDLWLVSTGTGLGPFISLLRTGTVWDRFERVVVVNGVRLGAHLGYREEFLGLSRERAGLFRYVPLATREDVPGALRERIPAALASGALERAAELQLDPLLSHVMLCGNPAMIQETIAVLGERGLKKHRRAEPGHISMEKYW